MTRKDQVAAAFSAATTTYEAAARAQAISADHLAAMVAALPRPPQTRVLEFGCGTGLLTRRLLPLIAGDWLITDLSAAMLESARQLAPRSRFQVMDAEAPELAGQRFDLIVSNLAAQWFSDLGAAINRLTALLAPGGHLVFSTLGAQSFRQWREAHQSLGLPCGIPDFPSRAALQNILPAARIDEQLFTLAYENGRAFAAELKRIGAGTPAPGHRPLKVADMRTVLQRLGQPAAITYDVLHVVIGPR
ncbi:MAG: Biotin synthesis protein [Rhodospirillaceae bacterium]|nr:MAG: Biotin synthesis protein [Rhodospirillaceae bacterium]TNC94401.1 MAG: Biotin synthesis protein BioC [Stygiobacter sp.]